METNIIYLGNNLETLKEIPDNSVNCCVTSPPYYALRDYGTGEWIGGDASCQHKRINKWSESTSTGHKQETVCADCGAVRVDNQIGLEETPEEYVQKLVEVFSEVKRILTDDGTLWLNIGDTYYGSGGGRGTDYHDGREDVVQSGNKGFNDMKYAPKITNKRDDLKPKDLIGIPWMLAFALRANGWYLRQDIIWSKPAPMPESVKDRCTKSHEYIFFLAKSQRYYFNHDAIQEPIDPRQYGGKRNKRDVWTINTSSYKGAHFATFPEELVTWCLKAGCPTGGIVLDPFMGSGTVGVVAKRHNMKYIGCELNPEYKKMAENRISNTTQHLF